jgi:hypothetical protein
MKPLLVVWDFHGVVDTFGTQVEEMLALVLARDGENILVSNSEMPFIEEFLQTRGLTQYFSHTY